MPSSGSAVHPVQLPPIQRTAEVPAVGVDHNTRPGEAGLDAVICASNIVTAGGEGAPRGGGQVPTLPTVNCVEVPTPALTGGQDRSLSQVPAGSQAQGTASGYRTHERSQTRATIQLQQELGDLPPLERWKALQVQQAYVSFDDPEIQTTDIPKLEAQIRFGYMLFLLITASMTVFGNVVVGIAYYYSQLVAASVAVFAIVGVGPYVGLA
mmetsp:Transcript_24411/g.56275  ORF Transcript_24411/g.56275 Transcript_24411/m.56275 type:complete len:210 (+) Transcript_24411:40-669(+)